MNQKLIIKNLKYCFELGLSFNELAIIENEFNKYELKDFIACGGFTVDKYELKNESFMISNNDLDFIFEGSRTPKEGSTLIYFTCKLIKKV
jgi:hypothetical protein